MKHWNQIVVPPDTTIEQALKIIDRWLLKIVLVVDENKHLLGTVVDGDIRRALINHIALDAPISAIMNKNPKYLPEHYSRQHIFQLMRRYGVYHMPIINSEKQVVGLEILDSYIHKRETLDNPVVLMAGGFGKRLYPLTIDCPKPLLRIGEKPILEIILNNFIEQGFYKFYISLYYMPQKIIDYFGNGQKWGVEIEYLKETKPLGTAGSLSKLPKNISRFPIIMMNGDLLTKIDFKHLLQFHNETKSIITTCARKYEYQVPYGVVKAHHNQLQSIIEKPTYKHFVNAGIYVVSPSILDTLKQNAKLDMPQLINNALQNNRKVSVFPLHEYWLDIGQMHDFEAAQKKYWGAIQE